MNHYYLVDAAGNKDDENVFCDEYITAGRCHAAPRGEDDENVFCDEYITAVRSMKKQCPFDRILFSSFIEKFNRRGQCTTRSIFVTENQIFKLHAQGRWKFSPMKDGRDISSVRTVTVTSCNDGLVVLDFGDKNDFVFYFSRGGCRVVEFVGVLAAEVGKFHSHSLNVIVADTFKFHIGGRSKQMILVKNHDKSIDEPYFRSKRSTVKFYWPLKELTME
uniref:TH1 domain-containing protein n=1 Tax=Romanomermis culicivorax TaxID=13658 RepID=A0A915JGU0_ROMCU